MAKSCNYQQFDTLLTIRVYKPKVLQESLILLSYTSNETVWHNRKDVFVKFSDGLKCSVIVQSLI